MRRALVLILLAAAAPAAPGQDDGRRYGVALDAVGYPQATPAEAVQSASKAAERGATDYLIAHLLIPAVADRRVAARAALVRPAVDQLLRTQRDGERDRTDIVNRLPLDEAGFQNAVTRRTQIEAFRGVSAGAKALLSANPRTGRELRRIAREGTLAEAGDRATFTLRGDPRQITLLKIGRRWYVDDDPSAAQAPAPAAAP